MESLYVLQLANGKYYVGKTTDVKRRLEEHMKGTGSEWTRLHQPIKVIETRRLKDEHDENNTTKDYMKKYGVDNVRGGSYSQIDLPTAYEKTLEAELRGNTNACFKCGGKGHFARDCPVDCSVEEEEEVVWCCTGCNREFATESAAEAHERSCSANRSKNRRTPPPSPPKKGTCYRCGRAGHYSPDCYAFSNVHGQYIGRPKRDPRYEWSDDSDSD